MTATEPASPTLGPRPAGAGPRRRRRRRPSGWPASCAPWFGVAKVGLELFSAPGPAGRAGADRRGLQRVPRPEDGRHPDDRRARRPGCSAPWASPTSRCTPSPARPCCGPGSRAWPRGPSGPACPPPAALAVTILTSDADAPPHILGKRVAAAVEARCAGVVCAAADVREAKQLAPRLLAVVPGSARRRPGPRPGPGGHPGRAAVEAGADLLVIGRAVTAAADRAAAAAAVVASIS